jgi:opacity protein-like surface antigen
MAYGAGVEYEITPNFRLRGEWAGFNTDTSDSVSYFGWGSYEGEFKLAVNAYTLSGIYRMSPEESLSPYIGAGIGQFKAKLEQGESGSLPPLTWVSVYPPPSETGEAIGFQALMGIEFGTEKFLLRGEARYISAEVEIEDFWGGYDSLVSDTKVDLGGLFLNVGAIIRF